MGWLGTGRPSAPRQSSKRHEERQQAMRSSRDSSQWAMTSPGGSTTGQQGYQQQSSQHYYGPSTSRRVSTQSSGRRPSSGAQQTSPLPSPRQQSTLNHQQQYQTYPPQQQHAAPRHNEPPPSPPPQHGYDSYGHGAGSGPAAGGTEKAGERGGGMMDRVRQAVQGFTSGGGGGSGSASQRKQQQSGLPEASSLNTDQVRELQHRVHNMEAQVHEVEELKQKLVAEQRLAVDWREKWNYQNFKLNLMVDMLVLQALESEGALRASSVAGGVAPAAAGQLSNVATFARQQQQQPVQQQGVVQTQLVGVGRQASSRRGEQLVEEEYDM